MNKFTSVVNETELSATRKRRERVNNSTTKKRKEKKENRIWSEQTLYIHNISIKTVSNSNSLLLLVAHHISISIRVLLLFFLFLSIDRSVFDYYFCFVSTIRFDSTFLYRESPYSHINHHNVINYCIQ